jgi:hypothetical protein
MTTIGPHHYNHVMDEREIESIVELVNALLCLQVLP